MLRLELETGARRFMESLPAKQFRQVARKIFSLADDPLPNDSAKVTGTPYRCVGIGEYRIVYTVTEAGLRVVAIGKRNNDEVYRRLKRQT